MLLQLVWLGHCAADHAEEQGLECRPLSPSDQAKTLDLASKAE